MKLQNHFTTIEQSKRLLELGVPANSADCCIIDDYMNKGMEILTEPYSDYVKGYESIYVPCWSVGRLMEIVNAFFTIPIVNWYFSKKQSYTHQIISIIENKVRNNEIDFSKLNERLYYGR